MYVCSWHKVFELSCLVCLRFVHCLLMRNFFYEEHSDGQIIISLAGPVGRVGICYSIIFQNKVFVKYILCGPTITYVAAREPHVFFCKKD